MKKNLFTVSAFTLVSFILMPVHAAILYVSPGGNDNAAGSLSLPFGSWAKAQTAASAGDTVYFRAGTYAYTKCTSTCSGTASKIAAVALNKSGSAGKLIHYFAYPGEVPVFDFAGVKDNCRIMGVYVTGNWIHLKGLELKGTPQNNNLNHESWCVYITGSNNIFELLNTHHNMGPGVIIWGGDGNLILNCDSHDNYDPLTSNGAGESGDGFGCHTSSTGGVGNVIRGCRAWWNSDDGYDCISNSETATFQNCWAWLNGYLPGTMTSSGNGNGIKCGGYGSPPSKYPSPIPQNTVKNCLSFLNKAAGFYQNHHPADNFYYNNTAYKNGKNFDMLGYNLTTNNASASMGIYKNNIALSGTAVANGPGTTASNNSWNISSDASVSDFVSIDTAGIYGPRKADGSLPEVKFMHLASASKLIDKGINVGLAFTGSAPDLGAFEYGTVAIKPLQTAFGRGIFIQTGSNLMIGGKLSGNSTHVHGDRAILYTITGQRIKKDLYASTIGTVSQGIFIVKHSSELQQ